MRKQLFYFWHNNKLLHPYVQGVKNVASDSPNAFTLNTLSAFFETINTHLSLTEMIKIYALKNNALTDFQLHNYVTPGANKSIPVSSPIYSDHGYRSAGAGSYVREVININRRAGIEDNFSELVSSYSTWTADETLMYLTGVSTSSSNRLYFVPKISGGPAFLAFNGTSEGTLPTGSPDHSGFFSLSSNGAAANYSRNSRNGNFTDFVLTTSAAPSGLSNYEMASCAWNNNGSVIRQHTQADVEFRVCGYEMSDAVINAIRTAWNTYKTTMGL